MQTQMPSPAEGILVTGGTGFLGSHFLLRLSQTRKFRICALVRESSTRLPQDRLDSAIRLAASTYDEAPHRDLVPAEAFAGDIGLPRCGIGKVDSLLLRLNQVTQIWHFASDLRYEEGNRDAIWKNNVDGTRNVLELARNLRVERFVYVSTAYSAGLVSGQIPEKIHDGGGPFNNVYEESKCATEIFLTGECAKAGIALTILRPSIVIGPRSTKRPDGTDTGLYGFIRAVQQLKSHLSGFNGSVRLPSTPSAEINFIPVDCVIDDMLELVMNGFGNHPIYHLTATETVTAQQCWNAIVGATGLCNVTLAPPGTYKPNAVERLLERRIGFFLGYINCTKKFQRAMGSNWKISEQAFVAYVNAALACQDMQEIESANTFNQTIFRKGPLCVDLQES